MNEDPEVEPEESTIELSGVGKVVTPLPPDLANAAANNHYITLPKTPNEVEREEEERLKQLRRKRGV